MLYTVKTSQYVNVHTNSLKEAHADVTQMPRDLPYIINFDSAHGDDIITVSVQA